jgi:tRNA U34 5-methylaminomethyl-2-thiouridine-forming methyltransferase MnmC
VTHGITPVQTRDSTWTAFSEFYGEHYHNLAGALDEAQTIYARHSHLDKRFKTQNEIQILDPFFGMGYNTFAAIRVFEAMDEPDSLKTLHLVCLEKHPEVLTHMPDVKEEPSLCIQTLHKALLEHNNYYQTQLKKEEISSKLPPVELLYALSPHKQVRFYYETADLRSQILELPNESFHLIYHDAFSPRSQAELWTVQLFKQFKRILSAEIGSLITYSCSTPLRGACLAAGLIAQSFTIENSNHGTLVSPTSQEGYDGLTSLEVALLNSRAGIPFRDNEALNLTREEILSIRLLEQNNSSFKTSSAVHKEYGNY